MFLTCSRVLMMMGLLFAAVVIGQISSFVSVQPPASSAVSNGLPRSGLSNHRLGDDDHEMFTFVQITDLHISLFSDPTRVEQLSDFCNMNLKAIAPKLVLVTGDLTDAVAPDKLVATQFEQEWVIYKNFYQQCLNVSGTKTWLDIRGNHDNFNVNGYNSTNSFYPKFGAQRERFGSYMVTINASKYTQYAFVAVDATLDLGPKRILNFIGALDSSRIEKLEKFQNTIDKNPEINATIWFGHYASSSILSAWPGLRQIAAKGIVYLCGHLHNLVDMVPQMYSHHHSGMMELELADWKLNRMYRVAAMDNGLFSFTDVKHGSWPVIVVTNPKPAETVQPSKEPTALMSTSSHIRLLIYSPSPIQLCEVRINDGPWIPCKLTGKSNPLYTAPWKPDLYSTGLHVLEARAKDTSGALNVLRVEFSLDGSRSEFPFLGRFILMIDITTLFQVLFGFAVAGCVVPFCIIRYIHQRILRRKLTMHRLKYRWLHSFSRKMWIFATTDSLFYPVSFYTLYLTFGPWFAGHVIDGRVGVVFPWGTIFQGHFLSGTFTYFYGLNQIVFFNAILILLLAQAADLRYQKLFIRNPKKETWTRHFNQLPFALFFLIHAFTCYPFWISYGYMATLLNPMRTWCLVLAVYLWLKAKRLDEASLMNVAKVWI